MAEGILKSLNPNWEVHSTGTNPSSKVHPKAVQVMLEIGIDIRGGYPKNVDRYLDQEFDYVITVCGHAKETCPIFTGRVRQRLHIGFDDPAEARGTEDEIILEFRKIRDEIRKRFGEFLKRNGMTSN
jgi:arsenate reductase